MSNEKKFVQGIYLKTVNGKFGDYTSLGIKTEEFIKFLKENTNERGYCNIDLKTTREGKQYLSLYEDKKMPF